MLYKVFRPILFLLKPETAHKVALFLLKYNLVPLQKAPNVVGGRADYSIAGLKISNPVGLAAGFDKDAECIKALARYGFGFIEVGTCTPKPQPGNAKPRLFRLTEKKSIANRFGFNSKGIENFVQNLALAYNLPNRPVIGANIGKNKDTTDISADYLTTYQAVINYCDYVTINISSPNTPGLRDIQQKHHLEVLLKDINTIRNYHKPLFLKISPDLTDEEITQIALTSNEYMVDGLILTNTTQIIIDEYVAGLSGRQLKQKSLDVLQKFTALKRQHSLKFSIISVGGIETKEDVRQRLALGACAVQAYSAFVFQGFGLVQKLIP